MRLCRSCGGFLEDHKVVGKRPTIMPRGKIPGHTDRLYQCDVVRVGTKPAGQGRTMPVWQRKEGIRDE